MRNKRVCIIIIFIVYLGMSCSLYNTYYRSEELLKDKYENELRVQSGMIASAIDNRLLRPIAVAETMSKDVLMQKSLSVKNKEEAGMMEKEASNYLESIRKAFGYSMVYAVSDASKVLYTYDGISRYIDLENDNRDIWYKEFWERDNDKPYKLQVDVDEGNNWSLSVFVNTQVNDDKGKCVGVCGVGVDMTEFQSVLERFERIYDVKINIVDSDGVVQIDTDVNNIGNANIYIENLDKYSDGECYYEIDKSGSRTITYSDNMGWYLVVQNKTSLSNNVYQLLFPNVIILVIEVSMVLGVFVWDSKKEKEQNG